MVRVTAVGAPEESAVRRTGFLRGEISVPDDFDRMALEPRDATIGEQP